MPGRRGRGLEKRPPVRCSPEGELEGDGQSAPAAGGGTDVSVGPGKSVFRDGGGKRGAAGGRAGAGDELAQRLEKFSPETGTWEPEPAA